MAVLFANDTDMSRLSFTSLRDPDYWPSDVVMEWDPGLLAVYASAVDVKLGRMGDFGLALYFGANLEIEHHFANCQSAVSEILGQIICETTSYSLYVEAQKIFESNGLRNDAVSTTDPMATNIGHSVPRLEDPTPLSRLLSAEQREELRTKRRFIGGGDPWLLCEEEQITVEFQVLSTHNSHLPKLYFHYVVDFENSVAILNDGKNFHI